MPDTLVQELSTDAIRPLHSLTGRRFEGEGILVPSLLFCDVLPPGYTALTGSPLELLTALRFQTVGHDPLTGEPLNVIEQLNQTFTILVSLRAVERLLQVHPEANGFRLALSTVSGRDIESVEPGLVAAEVFSATHPGSNQKLKKDIARLASDPAPHRYVFFAAPNYTTGRQAHLETAPGIEVHCVEL